MDLHMIITFSGIFVGMVVLIYGIYSYDKLKENESSNDEKDTSRAGEETKEIKNDDNLSLVGDDSDVKKEDEKLSKKEVSLVKEDEKDEISVKATDAKDDNLSIPEQVNEEISEFMNEEDFDNTLILDRDNSEESELESVTEITTDDKISSDVEDLFD